MAPARPTFELPALPEVTGRKVVDQALNGTYRRIQFRPEHPTLTLPAFFTDIRGETVGILLNEQFELKVCSHLHLVMTHKVGEEEIEEQIYLSLKATPLRDVMALEEQFDQRLDQFQQRGSGFQLKEVVSLEMEVCQYRPISFHVGHGKCVLPPKLASKKAVVNVEVTGNDCFR